MTDHRPIEILLVEDDHGDVVMTREALADGKVSNRLHVVGDGRQALDRLRGLGPFAGAARPDLVLLDLILPGRDGRSVLAEMKADPDLRDIPVVVLTTSLSEADIHRSRNLGAQAYLVKPVSFEHFIGAIQQVEGLFLAVVRRA